MNFKKYHVSRNLFPLDESKLHVGLIENDGTIDYQVGIITVGTDSVTYETNTTWRGFYTDFIQVNENEKLTISPNRSDIVWSCCCYDENDNFLGKASAKSTASIKIITLLTGTKKVRISVTSSNTTYTILKPMLNSGSQPIPYEPYSSEVWHDTPHYVHNTSTDTITTLPAVLYPNAATATVGLKGNTVQNGTPTSASPIQPQGTGDLETVGAKAGQYKIPISSANTTTPVYLGEVETTRMVKKLVLTGEENFTYDPTYTRFQFAIPNSLILGVRLTPIICSHLIGISDGRHISEVPNNTIYSNIDNSSKIWFIKMTDYTSISDFKAYLAQQYAAGTPVTVWYVLAEPQTELVNEPLMKIGDYADTVSGITIPTITGKDTFDVETTLKPSEVSLSYTGWHDATVKEWDGSDWQ